MTRNAEDLRGAGFIRSGNGDAMVIAPDGRLKAWRVDDKLTVPKMLNGQPITLTRGGDNEIFILALTSVQVRAIVGPV